MDEEGWWCMKNVEDIWRKLIFEEGWWYIIIKPQFLDIWMVIYDTLESTSFYLWSYKISLDETWGIGVLDGFRCCGEQKNYWYNNCNCFFLQTIPIHSPKITYSWKPLLNWVIWNQWNSGLTREMWIGGEQIPRYHLGDFSSSWGFSTTGMIPEMCSEWT